MPGDESSDVNTHFCQHKVDYYSDITMEKLNRLIIYKILMKL